MHRKCFDHFIVRAILAIAVSGGVLGLRPTPAQEKTSGATVRGRFVLPADCVASIALPTLQIELVELVEAPEPPWPENYQQLTAEQRQRWWNEYVASDAGQKYLATRKQLAEQARTLRIRPEPSGDFVLFDVPAGAWELFADETCRLEALTYRVRLSAEITIGPQVEEIQLGEIGLDVRRALQADEAAPDLQAKTIAEEVFSGETYRGRSLLVSFCGPPFEHEFAFQRRVLAAYESLKVIQPMDLLIVLVTPEKESFQGFVWEHAGAGAHFVWVANLDEPICRDFGVTALPSLWLINSRQRVAVTDEQFGDALRSGRSIEDAVKNAWQMRDGVDLGRQGQ